MGSEMKSRIITRRRAIVVGLASVGGFVAARSPGELPPTYGSLLRMADNLTYAAHRALLPQQALAREYAEKDITSFPADRHDPSNGGRHGAPPPTGGCGVLRSRNGGCRSRVSLPGRGRSRWPS